jgi:hypothetical protein
VSAEGLRLPGPADKAEAGTFKQCQELFGLSESTVRRIPEIKLIKIRARGQIKVGRTLVNFDSVRAFLGL